MEKTYNGKRIIVVILRMQCMNRYNTWTTGFPINLNYEYDSL